MLKDFQMFCVSVQGASHIAEGTPKEDDAGLLKTNFGWIGVVSDGHGDPRCMRSHIGSHMAVQIATKHLQAWLEIQQSDSSMTDVTLDDASTKDGTITEETCDAMQQQFHDTHDDSATGSDKDVSGSETFGSEAETMEKTSPVALQSEPSQIETDSTQICVNPESKAVATDEKPCETGFRLPQSPDNAGHNRAWSETCLKRLCHDIDIAWQEAVTAHWKANPLSEEEQQAAGNLASTYAEGKRIPHIYGATLLAAVMTEDRMLLIQKGDGHAMFVYENGITSHDIIPWDERCELNYTTSLCDDDAPDTFCFAVADMSSRPGIAAVGLATDGLEDCFASLEATEVFVGQTAAFGAKEGMENLEGYLESELSGMSDRSSRDDISIVGWINPSSALPLGRRFDLIAERYRAETRLKEAQLHIGSMIGSKQRIESRLQAMEVELGQLRLAYEALNTKRQELTQQLQLQQSQLQNDPDMRRTQGILASFGKHMDRVLEQIKALAGLQESITHAEQLLEETKRQQEDTGRKLQVLQDEYDDLKKKHSSFAERFQRWTDQQEDAKQRIEQIGINLVAPAASTSEPEDSEEAFRRMMED